MEIIEANGGIPPLTYGQFCHVTKAIGPPRRPFPNVDLKDVDFCTLEDYPDLVSNLTLFPNVPTPQILGINR